MRVAFEAVTLCSEKVLFINAAFGDYSTALTDFAVFIGALFLGVYPFARFIIEYVSGGDLYIRLGKQPPFAEYEVDVVIGLSLVVVESRYTFHIVPPAKFRCEIFKYLLRLINVIQCNSFRYTSSW